MIFQGTGGRALSFDMGSLEGGDPADPRVLGPWKRLWLSLPGQDCVPGIRLLGSS